MTRSGQSTIRRMLLAITLVAVTIAAVGCDGGDPRSTAEIQADVVASLLKGMKRKGSQLSAESYDNVAQELHGVRVTGKEGVLYAERATISVDEQTKAVRMKLFDVIVTQPLNEENPTPDGSRGQLIKYREMVLDDIGADGR